MIIFHNSVELDIRKLFSKYGYPGDDIPIIRGSASKALEGEKSEIGENSIKRLLENIDSYIPVPERDLDKLFLMPIEDVFLVTGRGTVVTGRIESGNIKVLEEVEIVGLRDTRKVNVNGVEMFRKTLEEGLAGDYLGLFLKDIKKEDFRRGMALAKPGSIKPHRKFKAEIYVLTKEEGGRHTPFFLDIDLSFFSEQRI